MKRVYVRQEWKPEVIEVANAVIHDIHKVAPELEVLFMGAAALGLPGKNDVDLDILCDQKDLHTYTRRLETILGEAKKGNDGSSSWNFDRDGFEVDVFLSDPRFSHVPEQKRIFDIMKSDRQAFDTYKQLKIDCDGLPYAEYERRKKEFYRELLS